jgi:hypothetical protein
MTSSAFSRQVNTVDRVSAHRVTPITRVAAGDLVTDNGAAATGLRGEPRRQRVFDPGVTFSCSAGILLVRRRRSTVSGSHG